ncbi:inositol monophosphatase [Carnobacterium divergens]|uniref:inositol monophosphatase family protein n=1 Tax=Carnobacterium divergens TaxID=2748 RepID=UPI001071DCE4|nr:inositol monophosphatase family protein [Carnobacterium divergens]MDT1996478.1 inositol monophosphatase family protein [Carnobacterium divergens]TFI62817.1 inositol monophosphatase [Carnobacterium divergens]TFI63168.1 inositol monophosphatase [Carnobacterium divergens]TFI66563.1 inositol monophosphatase [Carnobacterium divergens]TFI78162.1 inositol monophosphatase [Carnobacterium divergens]
MVFQKRHELIKGWILEAATMILKSLQEELTVEVKSHRNDLVTNMDKAVEVFLISKIQERFPTERIMGEEGFGNSFQDLEGTVWIIDPIDGTLNFIKQKRNFAIMIGVYHNGIGQMGYIYDVMEDEMYWAVKGQGAYCNDEKLPMVEDTSLKEGLVAINSGMFATNRYHAAEMGLASSGVRMVGSAGVETAHVVSGRLAAYLSYSLCPWDIAAGKVIAEEVGLVYKKLDGKEVDLLSKNGIIVATPKAYQEILTDYLLKP